VVETNSGIVDENWERKVSLLMKQWKQLVGDHFKHIFPLVSPVISIHSRA